MTGKHKDRALILFTREPEPGKTKTRLMPYFTPEQCAELHRCMLSDIAKTVHKTDADIIVSYTGSDPTAVKSVFHSLRCKYIRQYGEDLGQRMKNSISEVLGSGYKKAILIGADIPEIRADSITDAFEMLDKHDVVIGPTEDGGYYLIGMKKIHSEAFDIKKYGTGCVFKETVKMLQKTGIIVAAADMYSDIDTSEDIAGYRHRMRRSVLLRKTKTGEFLADTQKISVIVPVYNESAEIDHMMDQLTPYRDKCEIVIVDGGSTDDTVSKIQNRQFTLIRTDKGRGKQLNAGASAASGDILFFLHCDSVLPEDFLSEIKRVSAKNEWGCFGVRYQSRNFFMFTNRIISNHRALCRRLPFGDQGIFIDRDVFFSEGMFSDIPLMEDYEFSQRIRLKIPGPGLTRRRITSSARRYGNRTAEILKTEILMFRLRKLFRKGVSAEILQKDYLDIR